MGRIDAVKRSLASVGLVLLAMSARADEPSDVKFNRDVRPLLAEKCFRCHGPDASSRQAELRLDVRDNAVAAHDGRRPIVPGDSTASELIARTTSVDPDKSMPPKDSGIEPLTPREINLLRRWIDSGAEYEPHWAFQKPIRPRMPTIKSQISNLKFEISKSKSQIAEPHSPIQNPIDAFVFSRLEREGLHPSPAAARETLIRRVTLDLTGLPPTPDEVERFLSDSSPDAYDKLVDRLLASPRFGERLALVWLDAARFADSGGYQGDILRSMWLWRNWVIDAFNRNLPFDQFTIEQLAGDLLPTPTLAQRIATGFHRNHRINDEDGIVFEEFRVEYVVDRVETTATVFLGMTVACARCHDHKYDPVSQREFYQFSTFFNSVAEQGRGHGNAPPLVSVPSLQQTNRLAELDRRIGELQERLKPPDSKSEPNATVARDEIQKQLDAVKKERETLAREVPTTMVMQDLEQPRDTFVLVRGAYDKLGEKVTHGVPQVFPPLPTAAPMNRLGLAHWLIEPSHPLTARVAVNRWWQMLFGRGLVATPEDFGTRGESPSHPDLLDWLATEYIRHGWDTKALLRLIVTSATYQQSSAGSPALFARDPDNRWLARGPRFRLPFEMIRDQALAVSGLLVEQLGGPSVKPYQPPGLWEEMASADTKYIQDHGPSLYRRSLYTFIRRTVPPPAMSALDAPNRETCTVRRPRTNTPLQALVLMNDPTYLEAARKLAERVLQSRLQDDVARLTLLFRALTSREPKTVELNRLTETLAIFRERFRRDSDAATKFLAIGESSRDVTLNPTELAALSAVAGLIMNLDETVTKE